MPAPHFTSFIAIDWSGAKGPKHKGIAIAEARIGTAAPTLVRPDHIWSRTEVLDWLLERVVEEPTLFGFDFSFAPPFLDRGSYLPGEPGLPDNAREFWAYVDRHCADEDLGAASFLEQLHRRHFYFGIADGKKSDFTHFRCCDAALNAQGGRKTASAYDAIGASQVAKASFAGMRLLHHLAGRVPIWPFDPLPTEGSAVVEIYTRIALKLAGMDGRKLRFSNDLDRALAGLGRAPAALPFNPTDHQTDALVTAAAMGNLCEVTTAFAPALLTPPTARTEGWTFGVL